MFIMESYQFLLDIAIILISTKLLGIITKRFAMPQVVGALVAGVVLGPACLGVLSETSFMDQAAEIGVILLMFTAGLETDIRELKKSGGPALIIALCGMLVPLGGGFFLASAFNAGTEHLLENIFIGVVLTATSVSITVESLREMGKLSTRSGNAILGAALIDDILGIVALTLVTSMADPDTSILLALVKIAAFFAAAVAVGFLAHKLIRKLTDKSVRDRRRYAVLAFAMCLLFSYGAETFFGVADITGAYIAGLVIANTTRATYIASRCETASFLIFSPIFFASIGAKASLPAMSTTIVLFSVLLVAVAAATKVIGCGLGAKLCRYSNRESVQIGVGMICRGEVALIVTTKGMSLGLMPEAFVGPVILMVVACTIMTPILLKFAYRSQEGYQDLVQSDLVDQYEAVHDLDLATQAVLDSHEQLLQEGKEQHKKFKQEDWFFLHG